MSFQCFCFVIYKQAYLEKHKLFAKLQLLQYILAIGSTQMVPLDHNPKVPWAKLNHPDLARCVPRTKSDTENSSCVVWASSSVCWIFMWTGRRGGAIKDEWNKIYVSTMAILMKVSALSVYCRAFIVGGCLIWVIIVIMWQGHVCICLFSTHSAVINHLMVYSPWSEIYVKLWD